MNPNLKKFIIIFGAGVLLFVAFKRLRPYGVKGKKSTSSTPDFTDEQKKNAMIVVTAYSDAVKDGKNKAFLDEMNAEFVKLYGMRVNSDKTSGTYIATDLQGNRIK